MEKVPTAAEFLDRDESGVFTKVDIVQAMIEFTKMHVEAALKEASENGQAFVDSNGEWISSDVTAIVNKNSILNSYPLDNIK